MILRYRHRIAALAVLFLCAFAAVAHAADGPYLSQAEGGGWIAQWVDDTPEGPQARREMVADGDTITIPAADGVPAFQVRLRKPARGTPDAIGTPAGTPLLVVADSHGEFGIFVQLLQGQHVIDESLRWSFGRGHLVVLGDVFDRGAHQLEILWLLYQMQAEAAAAGGGVEFLLGNHEAMVLRGDLRYLHPRYPASAQALGAASYAALFSADSLLGQWLRTRAVALTFDDVLLVHGGVSPEALARGMLPAQLNRIVRQVLDGTADPATSEPHDFAMRSHGPLWYRGYFALDDRPAAASTADVEAILQRLNVDAILVGHTKMSRVTPLYGGRVIAVQVYPERDTATGAARMEAVRRDGGRWYRVGADGLREPLNIQARARNVAATALVLPGRNLPRDALKRILR